MSDDLCECHTWLDQGQRLVAGSKLAVDGQIEESQVPGSFRNLKPYSDGLDISQSEWGSLPD
ncbi:hypothetical protein PSCICF_19810 [Pseudomonas cichorii]|nr:hypothetical protein PSCICF_19810 [Pseudomonas cichorii]